jgi:hypothetical protein
VNAIYHKGNKDKPYHFIVHRFILVGIAILPAYSVISAYGIFSRIAQYGFTPDRLWAISIWFILSCFAVGYFIGIVKLRDNWLIIQSKVNVIMGLVLLAFVLLVNSPMLNFNAISSNSQMARYYSGEVALEDLDINYFINTLGQPGYLAMQQLKVEIAQSHPEIVASIDKQYSYVKKRNQGPNKMSEDPAEKKVMITYWPDKETFNAELIIHLNKKDQYHYGRPNDEYRLAVDIDQDGTLEMLTVIDQSGYFNGWFWTKTEDGWDKRNIRISVPKNKDLKYSLQNSKMHLVEPKYKIINFDGIHINVNQINKN